VPCYESAFRRWRLAPEFHHRLLGGFCRAHQSQERFGEDARISGAIRSAAIRHGTATSGVGLVNFEQLLVVF